MARPNLQTRRNPRRSGNHSIRFSEQGWGLAFGTVAALGPVRGHHLCWCCAAAINVGEHLESARRLPARLQRELRGQRDRIRLRLRDRLWRRPHHRHGLQQASCRTTGPEPSTRYAPGGAARSPAAARRRGTPHPADRPIAASSTIHHHAHDRDRPGRPADTSRARRAPVRCTNDVTGEAQAPSW